jgi:hypothetical protein
MALPSNINVRERDKFVEDADGNVAVRTSISGVTGDINVDSTSLSLNGYVGKASGTNADFITAYASATTLTCTTLPTDVSAISADDVVTVVQIATDGSVTNTYTRDDVTITASGTDPTTLTIAGATFAATDTFVVYTNIQRLTQSISDDVSSKTTRTSNSTPEWSHNVPEVFTMTNVANATPEYVYVNMEGYQGCSVHVEQSGGTDTFTGSFESSNEGAASTDDWIDTGANGWSPATAGGLTADFIYHTNKGLRAKAHRVKITTAGTADDADFNIFVYRW